MRYIGAALILGYVALNLITDAEAQGSEACIDCLRRYNPVDTEDGCVVEGNTKYCGDYRISAPYFRECMYSETVTDKDFESCTTEVKCATACVMAYQEKYAEYCLNLRRLVEGDDYSELTCADYARMHLGGSSSCGLEDSPAITEHLKNLTALCGCITIETCDASASTTPVKPLTNDLLVVYIVAPICGVIVIAAVIFFIIYLRGYRQNQRRQVRAVKSIQMTSIVDSEKGAVINGVPANQYMMHSKPVAQTATPPVQTAPPSGYHVSPSPVQSLRQCTQPLAADKPKSDDHYDHPIPVDTISADNSSQSDNGETSALHVNTAIPANSTQAAKAHLYENSEFLFQSRSNPRPPAKLPVPSPRQNI